MFPESVLSPSAADGLRADLRSVTIQELRNAARLWGWTVKGAAKADIIETLAQHLSNASEMATAFRTLSATQQQTAIWTAYLDRPDDQGEMLRTVIGMAEGRDLSKATITRAVSELRQRLIVFSDEHQGLHAPAAYREWLPCSDAPAMVYHGQPSPGGRPDILPALGPDELDQHTEHLLAGIERERPSAEQPLAPAPTAPTFQPTNVDITIKPHAGIVADELLAQWGYVDAEEQNLARTLLSILFEGGLYRLQEPDGRLQIVANQAAAWRDLSSEARLANLRAWWMRHEPANYYTVPPQKKLIWDELDLVLTGQTTYSLRQKISWVMRQQLDAQVKQLRAWLMQLLRGLREGVWFSFAHLLDLIYHLRRDLLLWTPYQMGWTWYANEAPLATMQMSRRAWNETFGALIEACLSGPASWLGLVQVAVEDNAIVAFMRPTAGASRTVAALAADTLRFLPNGQLLLRNSWRAGDLRQIIRQIAVETMRDRETTTYTLSAEAFRRTLQEGQSAEQVIAAFAAAGFPLPVEHADRLHEWQARMGRHQIYDNLGVIEFTDDETLAEVQATTGLGRADLYPISPRCLIVLRPETIPELLDELRRKGYTPQVIS